MGNPASKSQNDTENTDQRYAEYYKVDPSGNGTPLDPRSPTPEVTRTPLRASGGTKGGNITKNVDLRKTFNDTEISNKGDKQNPVLSAVIRSHFQSFDPRSPTQDFDRTPIVITSGADKVLDGDNEVLRSNSNQYGSPMAFKLTEEEFPIQSENNALVRKNLCDGFLDITLDDSYRNIKDTSNAHSTSPMSKNSNSTSVGSFSPKKTPIGLLETNLDYVETNLDDVKNSSLKENLGLLQTPNIIKFKNKIQVLQNDPRSPTADIDRTPIVIGEKGVSMETQLTPENSAVENVEEMSDDSLLKALQEVNDTHFRKAFITRDKKNKEGLLIFEDDCASTNLHITPKKGAPLSNNDRTPLSCMKNKTHSRSKSANPLYESKKQHNVVASKIPKRISKIPKPQKETAADMQKTNVSKTLPRFFKQGEVCENTPPHTHRDSWDLNTSIVL